MTQLSAHFTLEEATLSQTAARLGLENAPDLTVVRNMKHAALSMELVRLELGGLPININSWYRSPEVNKAVGSKPTSAHVTGFAIDFTCPKYGSPRKIVEAIKASNIQYQQLILEFPESASGGWAHISFNGMKRETLIIDKNGARPL